MAEEKKELTATDEAAAASSESVSAADKKVDKTAKKAKKKSDKKPLGKRIADWFRSYKAEMKKIAWAQPKDVLNNTVLVLVFMVLIAAVIALLDFTFMRALTGLTDLVGH